MRQGVERIEHVADAARCIGAVVRRQMIDAAIEVAKKRHLLLRLLDRPFDRLDDERVRRAMQALRSSSRRTVVVLTG